MEQVKEPIKILVRGCYDLQALRIQMGNRLCASFRSKLGIDSSEKEEELDEEGRDILKELRATYVRLADGVAKVTKRNFKADGIISTFTEFALVSQYFELETSEDHHFARLEGALADFPVYTKFLKAVKGVGPAMAAVIVSEIDIKKARHPSSLHRYAGLDVGDDGRGRSRKKEHLIKVKYLDKEGKEQERDSITFNPFLKTKLLGVLGPSFLKSRSPYSEIYYNTKTRLENSQKPIPAAGPCRESGIVWSETSKGHRHNAAIRKMVKLFLNDLYREWRTLEGLPVSLPYAEAKLGIVHGGEQRATADSSF